jgi:UDP-N-acetylglucosamine/UDP-N-acetylgalactosamine diphosphorylase
MDINVLRDTLATIQQEQALRFFDTLDAGGKKKLVDQLSQFDAKYIAELVKTQVTSKPQVTLPSVIQPVQAMPHKSDSADYVKAKARGLELLKQGKVAAFLVAGGQGTRLGYDGPKGEYPVTPIKKKPLFQVFAEQLLFWSKQSGKSIPWYIMTSDANDARTREFFKKHNHFGYAASDVFFFRQGAMPAFSFDGQMLLQAKDELALSPDGHGGSLRALDKSGALADMQKRGIEHLSYFQVDNPIVHTIDPLFLGLHDLSGSEMSSKTIAKAGPLERVGNFCVVDGVVQVIEYSDLPDELAKQTNPDGSLKFNAGSIAIHALRVSFIKRLNEGGQLRLPWHRAEKKVPYVDATGALVKPDKPNAVKLEQFVFDAIPLAKNAIVYTTDRSEEFSPVKNAEGSDSPATSRADQSARAIRWLRESGVQVPEGVVVEISPLLAATQEAVMPALRAKYPTLSFKAGESVCLE